MFWGLELPDPLREELSRLQRALRAAAPQARVGWTRREAMHLTLKFVGPLAQERVEALPELARELVGAQAPPGALELAGLGRFGSRRAPRVLWAGLEGPGVEGLAGLAGALERALVPWGVPAEGRPYRPHLTLGRPRRGSAGLPALLRALEALRPECVTFTPAALVLFRSSHGESPGPARYAALARVPFGLAGDLPANR